MKKSLSRVLSLIVSAVILLNVGVLQSSACTKDDSKPESEKVKGVEYWYQGFVPFTGEDLITGKSGSQSIRKAACSHFSMSYALVKMGLLDPSKGDTPITHIMKAREYDAFRASWGYYEFAKAPSMYDGVVYKGADFNVDGLNAEEGLEYVKGMIDQGYYVIGVVSTPETGGHCIFFDGLNEDGTMSIGDSWFEGTTWEDYYAKTDTTWYYLELLKCEGKEFKDQPSIYKNNTLTQIPEKDIVEFRKLVEEKDLRGLPVQSNLGKYIRLPSFKSLDSLMQHEKDNVVSIKETKDAKTVTARELLGAFSSFMGIIVITYSMLLVTGFVFNSVNSFIEIDVVKLLTFGHIKILYDKDASFGSLSSGYMSKGKFFIVVAIIFTIGTLLASGTVLRVLYYVASLV